MSCRVQIPIRDCHPLSVEFHKRDYDRNLPAPSRVSLEELETKKTEIHRSTTYVVMRRKCIKNNVLKLKNSVEGTSQKLSLERVRQFHWTIGDKIWTMLSPLISILKICISTVLSSLRVLGVVNSNFDPDAPGTEYLVWGLFETIWTLE